MLFITFTDAFDGEFAFLKSMPNLAIPMGEAKLAAFCSDLAQVWADWSSVNPAQIGIYPRRLPGGLTLTGDGQRIKT